MFYCLTKVIHEYDVFTESKVEVVLCDFKIIIIMKCKVKLIEFENYEPGSHHINNLLRYCILVSSFLTSLVLLPLFE